MYYFVNDYSEGCHERILKILNDTNMVQSLGYGEDEFCKEAKELIKKALKAESCDVHFMVGGTQTNLTVISSLLRPHEGVISVVTGHINQHETGAIEATGHKVLTIDSTDGKLRAEDVEKLILDHKNAFDFEHCVKPGMIYVTNPTELGTIYKYEELKQIKDVATKYNLPLFLDGARLASALSASDNDIKFEDYANLTDVFYIGGTKNGLLFGEAIVFCKPELAEDFRYMVKQKGGMLSKGRLLGLQFAELFRDGLYFEIGKHANTAADILRDGFRAIGLSFLTETTTNQVFPIVSPELNAKLEAISEFEPWVKIDDENYAVRYVTSFATDIEKTKAFVEELKKL